MTGHPLIDKQHAEIEKRIARFLEHSRNGTLTAEEFRAFLTEIHDYTIEHFRTEEALMFDVRYPNLWEHRDKHAEFWHELLSIIDACEACGYSPECGKRFAVSFETWGSHVHEMDDHFVRWLQAKTDGQMPEGD